MINLQDFEDIRPYYDHEARAVMDKVRNEGLFLSLAKYIWPEITPEQLNAKIDKVNDIMGFQLEFMDEAIRTIVARSSAGLTTSGFENLNPANSYLFVANHRDILLDSAILQIMLVHHGFPTSEITFGNNLMEKGFVTDFGKLNRMFTVQREGTARELYDISKKLSAYIRHTITEKNVSVWIAQRNGRSKDGHDLTQTGLLKMLNISGKGSFAADFAELRIVPLTISYEYEPCDFLKVQELYLSSLHSRYVKAPGEDLNSIVVGVKQPKGRIHLAVGKPILEELAAVEKLSNDNEKIKQLTALIDQQIYSDYKLWPVNYIAADLLTGTTRFADKYSLQEKQSLEQYIRTGIEKLNGEKDVLYQLFIRMYANPVFNQVNSQVTA